MRAAGGRRAHRGPYTERRYLLSKTFDGVRIRRNTEMMDGDGCRDLLDGQKVATSG
jgi:hypothetical protein